MNRQMWILLLGAVAIGLGQGCAHMETETSATIPETQPIAQAEAVPPGASPAESETQPPIFAETSPAAPTMPEPEPGRAHQLAHATILTDIEIRRQTEGVVVILTGDGELSYHVIRLPDNRLVVDLPDLVNGTRRQVMVVEDSLIRQIRIGSHRPPQQKVRLVLDLTRPVPYTVEKTGVQLRVMLAEQGVPPGSPKAPRAGPTVPVPERLRQLAAATTLLQQKQGPLAERSTPEPGERFTGRRISLDFQDAEISSVLRLIADVSGLNMVVGEHVKGKVTVKLLNVPWDQALDLILKLNQLGQTRAGNIIWIDTLANIAKQQEEILKAKEATVKAEPLITRIIYLNYADATKALDVAKSNLSTRGEIRVDTRTNALVVRDIEENVEKVAKMVQELDQQTPQVQIEARIVQANKTFARGLGVQWGIGTITAQGGKQGPINVRLGTGASAGGVSPFGAPTSNFLVNLPSAVAAAGLGPVGLTIGKFLGTTGTLDLRLSAGESLSLSKTISAPKVITLDNKPAKIESGTQIPFQTISALGQIQTTFIDAVLSLTVTPHVIPQANTVRLEIKATKNSLGDATVQGGLPTIVKNEAATEVILKDGETMVLGGIFEETRSNATVGIPWFNRIPFLGWLFKSENISLIQNELLVFVTPTIIKD